MFELAEEHRMLQDLVAKFIDRDVIPLEKSVLAPAAMSSFTWLPVGSSWSASADPPAATTITAAASAPSSGTRREGNGRARRARHAAATVRRRRSPGFLKLECMVVSSAVGKESGAR